MAVPPSRTPDAQALKRARGRYPEEPDGDGFYVRGRREKDGTWRPTYALLQRRVLAGTSAGGQIWDSGRGRDA